MKFDSANRSLTKKSRRPITASPSLAPRIGTVKLKKEQLSNEILNV